MDLSAPALLSYGFELTNERDGEKPDDVKGAVTTHCHVAEKGAVTVMLVVLYTKRPAATTARSFRLYVCAASKAEM